MSISKEFRPSDNSAVLVYGNVFWDGIMTPTAKDFNIVEGQIHQKDGTKNSPSCLIEDIGGNAANFSTGVKKLLPDTQVYSIVPLGDESDYISNQAQERMEEAGVQVIPDRYPDVSINRAVIINYAPYGGNRVIYPIISPNRKYQFIEPPQQDYSLAYITSRSEEDWLDRYHKYFDYAQGNNAAIAFSPGGTQRKAGVEDLSSFLKRSQMLFVNDEEAMEIFKRFHKEQKLEIVDLIQHMKDLCGSDGGKIISITAGEQGSYLMDPQNQIYRADILKVPAVEPTGAGEAYAAGVVAGWYLSDQPDEWLKIGAHNGASVVRKYGAQCGQLTHDRLPFVLPSTKPEIELLKPYLF